MLRLFLLAAICAVWSASAGAQTSCSNIALASLTSSTTVNVTPAYAPFSGSAITSPFAVTVRNQNAGSCSIAPIFVRGTAPVVMANGSFNLTYDINYNGTPVVVIGSGLSGFYVTVGGNGSYTFNTYNVAIAANQTSAAAGTFTDTQMAIHLYAYRLGAWQLVRTYPLTINATVNKTCTMSAASPSTLNFTSAIANGTPNPGVVLTSTLSNINCTFPSKITLSGSALQRIPAVAAAPGFDSFINYKAAAILGGASVTLTTTTSSAAVTSAGYNVSSGTTIGASLPVNVNLVAGQPLRSGSYSTTLSVTIDPTL